MGLTVLIASDATEAMVGRVVASLLLLPVFGGRWARGRGCEGGVVDYVYFFCRVVKRANGLALVIIILVIEYVMVLYTWSRARAPRAAPAAAVLRLGRVGACSLKS